MFSTMCIEVTSIRLKKSTTFAVKLEEVGEIWDRRGGGVLVIPTPRIRFSNQSEDCSIEVYISSG